MTIKVEVPMQSRLTRIAGLAFSSLIMLVLALACGRASSRLAVIAGAVTETGSMHAARASHTATLLPTGKVLIAGGFAGSGSERTPYSSVELYDPATGAFTLRAEMTTGRSGHTATLLRDGTVLIAGGWGGAGPLRTAELYDPATAAFTLVARMQVARAGHTATRLPDGMVLLAGGEEAEGIQLSSAELYDPARREFISTGNMAVPRAAHTATLLKTGEVLIAGGSNHRYPNATVLRSAELYDPAKRQFFPTGEMAEVRHKHAATLLASGNVLIVGGSNNREWRGEYSSAELYDPAREKFSPAGSMSLPRFKLPAALALLANGRVLVAGGAERVEVYDPATGTFLPCEGSLGVPNYYSSATSLTNGRVLINGGYGTGSRPRGPQSTAGAWVYQP